MNRHVIRGRGPNRGKYLRQRYSRKLNKTVTTWTPKQAHAWRCDAVPSEIDGYLVKLTALRAIMARVDDLRAFIRDHAAGADARLSSHWVHGACEIDGLDCDEATDFCHDCCEAKVAEIVAAHPKEAEDVGICVDGGWGSESDSAAFCETCGAKLDDSLTEYGADEEISALTGECAPGFDDPNGWDDLCNAMDRLDEDDPRWRAIARVVDAAAAAEREHDAAVAAFSALPGMAEARTGLLDVLGARLPQKATEPSYRLWDEFQTWMVVRHDETPETEATEKHLFKEAIRFLGFCGIRAYMTNGGMGMAAAPHGTYYWPFIVETEQHRLWKDVDMEAGRTVGLRCLDSDDAPGRDANPLKLDETDAARSRAWDDGFLVGLHEADKARHAQNKGDS